MSAMLECMWINAADAEAAEAIVEFSGQQADQSGCSGAVLLVIQGRLWRLFRLTGDRAS
ncbi:hypothetical protein [Paenibacillus massiliensis]|uniref:hypothetical protein n=1 Tax=Paenibacillus massiliensis TaxID=225917 RepID=UPI0012EC37B0|nr:hypothetical protein [Paenibacillus massiliensis]